MLNNGQKIKLSLTPGDLGHTLATFFAKREHYFEQVDVPQAFAEGCVLIDQQPADPDHILQPGENLHFYRKPWHEPEVPSDLPVLFENPDLLVVDKPAGLPMMPCGEFYDNCLLSLLKTARDEPLLSPVHRLDLETSGVCVLTRTKQARGFFQRQFQERRVDKHYHALTLGHFPQTTRCIDQPLGRHERIHTRFVPDPDGIAAITEIEGVEHWQHYSKIWAKPITGRTNQIRAHLAGMGHAIVGDKKYHPDPEVFFQWLKVKRVEPLRHILKLERQALHCASMTLHLPDGATLKIDSTRDMFALWQQELAADEPRRAD